MKQLVHMKTRIIGEILVALWLVFVLGSAITQVRAEDESLPVVTIHSTGDVARGKTGAFVLNMKPPMILGVVGFAGDEMVFVVEEVDFFLPRRVSNDFTHVCHANFRMLAQPGIQGGGSSLLSTPDHEINE